MSGIFGLNTLNSNTNSISDFIDVTSDGGTGSFILVDLDGGGTDFGNILFAHVLSPSDFGAFGFETQNLLLGTTVYGEAS
jgi:hypothetical protein